MHSYSGRAIQAVNEGKLSYCKFLSANDTGDTGAHQAGIYIAKNAVSILFDEPGMKGSNKDKLVQIRWQDDFTTESRFIYYGTGTRNEYRITRFQRSFPFLTPDHTGDLFILTKYNDDDYTAYILESEDDINAFLGAFAMGPKDTGAIIQEEYMPLDTQVELAFEKFIRLLSDEFPTSVEMSLAARRINSDVYNHDEDIHLDPDKKIIGWIDTEYRLFRKIEFARYGEMITQGFSSVEQFIDVANMVLNRRKSRAGRSLEHHLAAIFDGNSLTYQAQARTEGNKRPDFIFPGESAYHNVTYPTEQLIFLGAKTTCKDRWRQVINEANRIKSKHLFTLQQGISIQQLSEMEEERVTLVVPAPYINTYPKEKRGEIWTLNRFIAYAREKATK